MTSAAGSGAHFSPAANRFDAANPLPIVRESVRERVWKSVCERVCDTCKI